MKSLKFICNEPAALYKKTLIVADLHLGVERSMFGAIQMDFFEKTKEKLLRIMDETNCDEVVIVGDLKHDIPGMPYFERKKLKGFVDELKKRVNVVIVMGNHDGGVRKIAEGVEVHGAAGVMRDSVSFTHGHAWPSERMMKADWLVVAHNHPCIEFVDKLGYRRVEKVWVVGEIDERKVEKKFKEFNRKMKFVVMPAFSELVGGMVFNSANRKLLGPMFRNEMFKLDEAEITLLSGVKLGKLKEVEE
ncbi:MAG: metallophosphoesterase [Candidatus Micrarchaeia archaeon]